jgi:hypothetical protein
LLPPERRGRRQPALLLGGFTLAAIGGLAAQWLIRDAGERVPVLVVARPVHAGDLLKQADLRAAELALEPGVAAVSASQADLVIGRVARVDLVTGSVVAPEQVGDTAGPSAGQVLVVLGLTASRLRPRACTPGTTCWWSRRRPPRPTRQTSCRPPSLRSSSVSEVRTSTA